MSKERILTSFIENIPIYLGSSLRELTEKNLSSLSFNSKSDSDSDSDSDSESDSIPNSIPTLNTTLNTTYLNNTSVNGYKVIYHNLIEYINKDSKLAIQNNKPNNVIDEPKLISEFLIKIDEIKHEIKLEDFKRYIEEIYKNKYTFNCERINGICDRLQDKDAIIQYIIFLLIIESYSIINITSYNDDETASKSGKDDYTEIIEINRKCLIYLLLNDIPFPFPFINQEDEEYSENQNFY